MGIPGEIEVSQPPTAQLRLEAINSVHRCYAPHLWRRRNHYVLWFHDTTFECVAESFQVEIFRESMADLVARVCQRLLE
jgi:hypothetical protein